MSTTTIRWFRTPGQLAEKLRELAVLYAGASSPDIIIPDVSVASNEGCRALFLSYPDWNDIGDDLIEILVLEPLPEDETSPLWFFLESTAWNGSYITSATAINDQQSLFADIVASAINSTIIPAIVAMLDTWTTATLGEPAVYDFETTSTETFRNGYGFILVGSKVSTYAVTQMQVEIYCMVFHDDFSFIPQEFSTAMPAATTVQGGGASSIDTTAIVAAIKELGTIDQQVAINHGSAIFSVTGKVIAEEP